jgi:3-oxoacyl-[acyl-carrier-protein] synthase II
MTASSRRIVITGIGLISPLGLSLDAFWTALCQGRSGIRRIRSFDASGLPVQIAGEIDRFDAKLYLDKKDRKSLKVMARPIQLAIATAQLALDQGAVDKSQLDPERFGVEFGASLIASELAELGVASQLSANCQPAIVDLDKWGEQSLPSMPPLWMLKYLPNMLACHVSILHNAQGPNNTITEANAAGLLALGEAYRIIARDQADIFLVGGADSKVNPLSLARQCLFEPLSRRNEAPEQASRPFDRRRDGTVLGEGGAVFVLEELEHARRRRARILAEVVGFAATFDRARSGAGIARAVRAALTEAGVQPSNVDHVNANGTSDVDSDVAEAAGLREVFGDCRPPVPVFAAKSYFGNLEAGSGPVELAASLLALEHGVLPRTLNYEEPDPACPICVAAGEPCPVTRPYVLKVSFTDMGQCAALVCRKWTEA